MNREFLEKMIEAKKLERDAIFTLLDFEQREHIQVIENELLAMLKDIVLKSFIFQTETENKQSHYQTSKQEYKKEFQKQNEKNTKNTGKRTVQKINIE